MLYGPLVLRFFDKTLHPYAWTDFSDPLDICVHIQSLDKLIEFIRDEGFFFNSHTTTSFRETVNRELANTKPWKLKSSGERNASQADHSAWGPFTFGRLIHRHWYQRVNVHVVRCEPYQHVLSLHSSESNNYIDEIILAYPGSFHSCPDAIRSLELRNLYISSKHVCEQNVLYSLARGGPSR